MKITLNLLIAIVITMLLAACASSKKVAYFQDIDESQDLKAFHNFEPTIQKDDKLNIIVSGPNDDVVTPYNSEKNTYLVDINGYINFPIL